MTKTGGKFTKGSIQYKKQTNYLKAADSSKKRIFISKKFEEWLIESLLETSKNETLVEVPKAIEFIYFAALRIGGYARP